MRNLELLKKYPIKPGVQASEEVFEASVGMVREEKASGHAAENTASPDALGRDERFLAAAHPARRGFPRNLNFNCP